MRLDEMLAELEVDVPPGARGLVVTGVAHDSRRVRPGDLFVAIAGGRHDGRQFVPEAVARGAVAVLATGPVPAGVEVPWIEAADPRRVMGEVAARLHGHPDRRLLLAGVTGTNGKSTVVALLASILEAAGRPCARLGTLGSRFGDLEISGEHTTPEAPELFAVLATMVEAGAQAAVMEVSSHAVAFGRVAAARFDLVLFTNLTHDHIDFHGDLESYYRAKRGLFELLERDGRAVVHLADAWGERLARELPRALTCGPDAAVTVAEATLDLEGIRGTLELPRGRLAFHSRLLGRFNLDNVLSAAAGAEALGLPHDAIADGIAACPPLPGRLERINGVAGVPVFVDYAHTPAALEAVLQALRELCPERRLIVVFGCGGDRDREKRAPMGRLAGELADLAILTSDNPRGEDPLAIIAAVEEGMRASGSEGYRVVPDRREAIHRAIAVADEDSVVLLAGKGHEAYQIIGEERLPFSDSQEALAALEGRDG